MTVEPEPSALATPRSPVTICEPSGDQSGEPQPKQESSNRNVGSLPSTPMVHRPVVSCPCPVARTANRVPSGDQSGLPTDDISAGVGTWTISVPSAFMIQMADT